MTATFQAPWLVTTPRADRVWQPLVCPSCGGPTRHIDLGSLHKRDAKCTTSTCQRYGQTWTYADYRGLTGLQRVELAWSGIFLDPAPGEEVTSCVDPAEDSVSEPT